MEWDIAYNTTQDELLISEYGRTVQVLLRKANAIEDDEERQAYVERVIKLMLQMEPEIKTQENYEERLWKHAFLIAGEPLNVTVPEGINLKDEEEEVIKALPYPDVTTRMRHYGQNVQQLIKQAAALEDGPEKDNATYIAAYYMKIALTSWASGQFVNEDMIRKDLYELSEKKLMLGPEVKIGVPGPNQPEQHQQGRKKKKKNKNNRPNSQGGNSFNGNRSGGGGGGGGKSRGRKNRRR
jgi:uncharacterized membrane protein YgcG